MNEKRIAVVKHAFQVLNKDGTGQLHMDNLVQIYDAKNHPRVKTREKKPETVMNDFGQALGARSQNGIVTENSFIEYYADINATLPSEKDDYFIDLVLKTWGVNTEKSFVPQKRIDEMEKIIFEKIRQKTHGADDEGKTARRIFKHFDLDGFGTIEPNEFRKALETIGCLFKEHEMDSLFKRYDKDSNGKLDYEEFSNAYARMGSGNNPNVNPVFGLTREPPNQVL
jgi:Ca2+-binding EF-hand superfamily protein